MFARFCMWLALVSILSGCVVVPRQSFNKAANPQIKTIAVLPVPMPKEHFVHIINHPGMSFGLIGGLIAASDAQTKTDQFTAAIKQRKEFNLSQEMIKALQGEGGAFTFQPLATESAGARTAFLEDYSSLNANADAYLDIVVTSAGYTAQYPSTPYVPSLYVPVRLVDAKTKQVLYSTLMQYGDANPVVEVTHIQPPDSFRFADFNALMAQQDMAANGLLKGAEVISKRIVSELQ